MDFLINAFFCKNLVSGEQKQRSSQLRVPDAVVLCVRDELVHASHQALCAMFCMYKKEACGIWITRPRLLLM